MASQPPVPEIPSETPVDPPVPTPTDPVPPAPSDPVIDRGAGGDPLTEGP